MLPLRQRYGRAAAITTDCQIVVVERRDRLRAGAVEIKRVASIGINNVPLRWD